MTIVLHARTAIQKECHDEKAKFVADRAFKALIENPQKLLSKYELCAECKTLNMPVVDEKVEKIVKRKPRAAKKVVKEELKKEEKEEKL